MQNNNNLSTQKILFIGGGNMASAIINGLAKNHLNNNIYIADNNKDKLEYLKNQLDVNIIDNLKSTEMLFDIIILAVKPKDIKAVCLELSKQQDNLLNNNCIIISVAAGITLEALSTWLNINNSSNLKNKNIKLVRSMPNTPASIQRGITILYSDQEYIELSDNLFKTVGETLWVQSEQELNNAMAISGCGPAYVFLVIESLINAAKNVGIKPEVAKKLATETILGATEYFKQSTKEAEDLRKAVTSPNGTTEAALNQLNINETQETYKSAILAAIEKAKLIEDEQFN